MTKEATKKHYSVQLGFRRDIGACSIVPTHFDTFEVVSTSAIAARADAIDLAYKRYPDASHFQVEHIEVNTKVEALKCFFDAGEYLTTDELEALYKAFEALESASKVFGESASMAREWAIRGSIPVLMVLRARNVPGY